MKMLQDKKINYVDVGTRSLETRRGRLLLIDGEEDVVERRDSIFRYDAPSCGAATLPSRFRAA